jgi:signal transduction histidine kinase
MHRVRDVSIRLKLTLLLLSTVSVALILSSLSHVLVLRQSVRDEMVNRFQTLANVLAANIAPALRLDPAAAQQALSDLQVENAIVVACAYDSSGTVVARYEATKTDVLDEMPVLAEGFHFTPLGHLELFRPVVSSGETVGTLFLRVSTVELNRRLFRHVLIAVGILVGCSIIAALLAGYLQRVVSKPILELAQATKQVRTSAGYSIRVTKTSNDELGALCDDFNAMLAQLQIRDAEIREHRLRLERTVQERTRDLEAKTAELSRSNLELEQFAYVASHDLQEPLRMVASYCQLLERRLKDKLDAETKKFLGYCIDGAVRMQGLINDLLAFSRVGRKGDVFRAVESLKVVERATANLQASIQEKHAHVTHDDLPAIQGDPTQLTQLFQNLIGNGIKYCEQEPNIHISAQPQDGSWHFAVRDNGIGIDAEHFDRIFVIFQRLHGRGSKYSGTGIGLALCKKIVEHHGGRIWVESQPGQGTTFHFTISA